MNFKALTAFFALGLVTVAAGCDRKTDEHTTTTTTTDTPAAQTLPVRPFNATTSAEANPGLANPTTNLGNDPSSGAPGTDTRGATGATGAVDDTSGAAAGGAHADTTKGKATGTAGKAGATTATGTAGSNSATKCGAGMVSASISGKSQCVKACRGDNDCTGGQTCSGVAPIAPVGKTGVGAENGKYCAPRT